MNTELASRYSVVILTFVFERTFQRLGKLPHVRSFLGVTGQIPRLSNRQKAPGPGCLGEAKGVCPPPW